MKTKSFTLIELLVVIVIIGILAGVIIVSVSSSINKANFAKAQSFSNTVQNELLGDLVSEWTFDEDLGVTAKDTWGTNDGTLMGANGLPQLQTKENCVYGTCYLFDGVDDYIDCGSSLNINKLTISGWIKISGLTGTYQFLFSHKYEDVIYVGGIENSGKLSPRAYIKDSLGNYKFLQNSNYNMYDNNWHNLILTYSDGVGKLWLDGVLVNEDNSFVGALSSSVKTSYISSKASYFLKGFIDDVRIYDSALTSSQIKQQYVAGLDSLLSKDLISQEEYNQKLNSLAYEN